MDIPVYLFTGFLESGKTKFIQETLEDSRFSSKEKTLLLICEEGFSEYDPATFIDKTVYCETVENESDLTREYLAGLQKKYSVGRVLVEYNGMWQLNSFYSAMPKQWVINQEFMFACATTFENYNSNMRSLVVDKLQTAELVVFNRYVDSVSREALHKIVRGISRRADIAYEYADGKVEYDEIEDPLPFDPTADIIRIDDRDFAIFYRDLSENMKKYNGKTVKFRGIAAAGNGLPKGCFAIGRHIMTCCANDIQYSALICESEQAASISSREWFMITAKIEVKKHKAYGGEGPVLTALSLAATSPADPEVATFY